MPIMNLTKLFLKNCAHTLIGFTGALLLFQTSAAAYDVHPVAVDIAPSAYHALKGDESLVVYETPEAPAKTIYDYPYSLNESYLDSEKLKRNTFVLVGAGVATLGILYLMPSSFTNWEDDGRSPFSKWWDNVSGGPVWDKDDFFLNYIAHPYVGALYYMGARSAGADAFDSFLYSFALSTFFWECGIEAFAEKPSIQDLIVTPVGGAIIGEGFYLSKRYIIENNYVLLDSKRLGKAAVWLMDPITEAADYFWSDTSKSKQNFSLQSHPTLTPSGHFGYTMSLKVSF